MKLYMFPVAPNAAKVRLYLAEKKEAGCDVGALAPLEQVLVDLREGGQKKPDYLKINPFGTVPALELDDGRVIHESLPIIDYLEECYPEASMWGADPASRAVARQIERIADLGLLIGVARDIHSTNSPLGWPPNPPVAAHYRERWTIALEYLENLMADGRPFVAGDRVTVGDCTIQAILQFARFRELPVLENAPRMAKWNEAFRARPAAKATLLM